MRTHLNSLEKPTIARKQARKRKRFIKRYRAIFAELGIKPFATAGGAR